MHESLIGMYVLVWPAIVAFVLWLMIRGVVRDLREAQQSGEDLV